MRSTKAISVTLPLNMVRMIKTRVASGQYASESEVVRDGLRTLQARDAAVEAWLRGEVARSYDEHKSDPGKAIPLDKVMSRLHARRSKRKVRAR